MHVQIVLISGRVINLPMSWHGVLNGPGRLGEITLDVVPGIIEIIPKSSILGVHQFTDDAWEKVVAEGKVRDEAQKKAQEDQRKAQGRAQAQAVIDAWKKKPLWKRIGKRCSYTLPVDPPAIISINPVGALKEKP